MSAHHNAHESIQDLYEGDQSKLYSGVYNHHTDIKSEESKAHVKKIWMITLWLSIITIVEVAAGLYQHSTGNLNHVFLITYFLVLTILKAYLIVKVFMHLGDEWNSFVMVVLGPLALFIWFIIAFLYDADFSLFMNSTFGNSMPTVK